MKRAKRHPSRNRHTQKQQGGPPVESPATTGRGPFDDLIELSRRGYACTACIETKYPPPFDVAPVYDSIRGLLRILFTLDAAGTQSFNPVKDGSLLGDRVLALYDTIDGLVPASQSPPAMASLASTLLMASSGGLPIMASMGPGLPGVSVSVAELIPLLEALVMELEEAANVLPGGAAQQARALVEALQQILRMLRSMGAGTTLSLASVLQMLRNILPNLLALLRDGLTGARFRLVLQAIIRFGYGVAALIPEGGAGAVIAGGGGAAGGTAAGAGASAGAGAGAAAAVIFAEVIACLLAAGLGCLIGWWLGNLKVRNSDVTIHEWWGDCFYWLFWAPDRSCDGAFEAFAVAQSKAREARDANDKEGETAAVATAIASLQQYIRLKCDDDLDIFRRQVERMQARLRELLGE